MKPPHTLRIIFPLLLLITLVTGPARAAERAAWRVGFARAVITPPHPVPLAGYAARTGMFRRVEQAIHVKALALEDAQGGRALLITCDLVGLGQDIAEEACRRIMAEGGLAREAILLNYSHTHTGPAAALNLGPGGRFPPAEAEAIVAYGRWLVDRIVEAGLAALEQRQPAALGHAAGLVNFPVNRREYTAKGIILGFNPRGPTDRSVPVLRIASAEGALLGVVFGAACHNTCLTAKDNDISGDYAGQAQARLEQELGVPAMFMQGCGGDTSPYPTGRLEYAQAHGNELAREVRRVLAAAAFRPLHGSLRTKLRWADLPLEPAPSLAQIDVMARDRAVWRQQAAAQLRALHASGALAVAHHRTPLALWQFGEDLTLVGLPGEPVADYVRAIEQALGPLRLWIAGYCNDHFGYLSNPRILAEGGYEGSRGLGHGRRFKPEVEAVVLDGLRELAVAAGRPGLEPFH